MQRQGYRSPQNFYREYVVAPMLKRNPLTELRVRCNSTNLSIKHHKIPFFIAAGTVAVCALAFPITSRAEQPRPVQDPMYLKRPSLDDIQRYYPDAAMVKGIGGRAKLRKMQWCLAEGIRTLHRRFLKRACTISVFQDGRHNL